MPAGRPDDVERVEVRIRSIRDPVKRAQRAVEEHRAARVAALRLADVRRAALGDLHDSGMTWQEVADAVGLTLKAVTKAVGGPTGAQGSWWKRIPDTEAQRHKRGPGGIPLEQVVRKEDLMAMVMAVVAEREKQPARSRGRPADAAPYFSPAELLAEVTDRMGRPVAMPSLRAALNSLISEGRLAKAGVGRYVASPPGGDRRRRGAAGQRRR